MKFVIDRNIPLAREGFGPLGEITLLDTPEISADSVRNADVVVVRSETRVGRTLLEGSRVKFVGTTTIGYDHVDVGYLASRGIAFASAPGCNANAVTEYVVAALLHLSSIQDFRLHGAKLGVVGVGNVGSRIVRAGRALGMTVLQNDPPLARATGDEVFVPLDDLMECDVITLHVPLLCDGPDPTYHLFDDDRLRRLKHGTLFINTSRGGVVATAGLRAAISSRRLSATVIDVWEDEPDIDAELLSMVTLGTPHIAGHSLEGKVNGVRMVREALCRFFRLGSSWNPDPLLPFPPVADITLPEGVLDPEVALHQLVPRCYDITMDDKNLRSLVPLSVVERSSQFKKLRSEYRIRREFSNVTVHLRSGQERLEQTLVPLGFRISSSI